MPSTVIFNNPVASPIFASWGGSEWLQLLEIIIYAWTLGVLIKTFKSQQESTWLQRKANKLQSKSAERTARMEMAKVLTEAFSHSEMFVAIEYFLQVSPCLVDENGKDRQIYIEGINEKPETKEYRYRILTTLRHAQRLYDTEKADKTLFTSLITPDILEVTLCLHKLNDYIKDFNEPVYKMVYKVFEGIRTSYLEPYWDALDNKKEIAPKRLQETRRILKALQHWDRLWGDDGDRILTEKDLLLLDVKEKKEFSTTVDKLIQRFQVFRKDQPEGTNLSRFAELYYLNAEVEHEQGQVKYESAKKNLTEAIKHNSEYPRAHNLLGCIWLDENNYVEASKCFTKAMESNPNYATPYVNLGAIKHNDKDYEEAIKYYTKAIELNPQDYHVYNKRGLAKLESATTKRFNEDLCKSAIIDYTLAITNSFEGNIAPIYYNRGFANYLLDNFDESINDFTQALKIDPYYADTYNNRGLTYQAMAQQARDNGNEAEAEEFEAKAQADFAEYKRLTEKK